MQHSLLTAEDHHFLGQHAAACRLGFDFMLEDLLRKGSSYNVRLACAVPIWFEGGYLPAEAVVRKIEKSVTYSQIYEQYQARVYDKVMRTTRSLSAFDARVLLVAAGFDSVTAGEIYSAESEAVNEARRDLYGDDEDHI
uniref:Uncharacterized protein n=1 Tax=Pseudomonas fluorescens (strain SBW25) TaxID=216595 RepID=A0A0G4E4L2_PSEFS|nr:hypothetical protein [Pseudomonas fluorescens]CEK42104.1 hypothetical protein PQBR57_0151 [Pseudomonas fluorescens SBW25]